MTAYFVSTLGKDTAPGSQERPLRNIGKAVALAKDGDTVFVRGGTWRERVTMATPGVTLSAFPAATGYEPVTLDGEYRLPDTPLVAGGTNAYGTWLPFNYSGLLELFADRTIARGITTMRSVGRGIEVGGVDDARRTTGNVIEDCQTIDHRHCGLGAKYFNSLTVRRHRNSGTGNFAPYRRPTAKALGLNHPASCSFQVGNGLVVEEIESVGGWGEGVMFNCVRNGRASGVRAGNNMSGDIYFNEVQDFTLDGWLTYYSDSERPPAGSENQAGVFINREDHKSDWGAIEDICRGITIRNGVAVNCDRGISLLGALGLFLFEDISFVQNTIVRPSAFPKAGQSSAIFVARQGQFRNISFDRNLVCLTDPATQAPVTAQANPQVRWLGNAWSHRPPTAQRSTNDIVGDLQLVNPAASIAGDDVDMENYRLKATSPALGFGVLGSTGSPTDTRTVSLSNWRRGLRRGVAGY